MITTDPYPALPTRLAPSTSANGAPTTAPAADSLIKRSIKTVDGPEVYVEILGKQCVTV
jgi:hypothetical protein